MDRTISFREALKFWLKLGFISFGGPAGQIAMLHKEVVDNRKWVPEDRFLHSLAAVSFMAIYFLNIPFPVIVFTAGLAGYALNRRLSGDIRTGGESSSPGPVLLQGG